MFGKSLVAIALAILVTSATTAMAGAPTDQVRETSDKIIAIVKDQSLQTPGKETEKYAKIRAAVDERFDWAELAKRSLGRHWAQRTPQEKQEFTKLFSDLIERTYMEKVEGYKGQPINYLSEKIDENYATVKVAVEGVGEGGSTIPVEYRMQKKENNWMVYDVAVEGVSLVNNYRTQFSDILGSSSYDKLVERVKAKLREEKVD